MRADGITERLMNEPDSAAIVVDRKYAGLLHTAFGVDRIAGSLVVFIPEGQWKVNDDFTLELWDKVDGETLLRRLPWKPGFPEAFAAELLFFIGRKGGQLFTAEYELDKLERTAAMDNDVSMWAKFCPIGAVSIKEP